jgi:muconate cycloisomerase
MHIAELSVFHVRIPLKKTIRHASHTRDSTDSLVVRCRLSDGQTGWGEGLPRSYVTGESIDDAWQLIRAADFKPRLSGSFDGLAGAIAICRNFDFATRPPGARDCFGNSARCAIELSILDAAARAEAVPLSRVTSLAPECFAVRQSNSRVRYSGAVTPMGSFKEITTALKLRLFRFQQCKVKVGTPGVNDQKSLGRIRRALGRRVDIRIDANEAWTCENLERQLQPLLPFGITALEQPVPHAQVNGLAEIRRRIDTPVMLDESLCSLSDAHRAIERGTCDLFNIRLSKCGGFVNSLQLAGLAHQAGLGYQLGCQVGETGILSAAGRHFACSVGEIRYLEGSFDRFLVRERLTVQDLTFGIGGWAPALQGPGLGVDIDDAALKRVTVAEQSWNLR